MVNFLLQFSLDVRVACDESDAEDDRVSDRVDAGNDVVDDRRLDVLPGTDVIGHFTTVIYECS